MEFKICKRKKSIYRKARKRCNIPNVFRGFEKEEEQLENLKKAKPVKGENVETQIDVSLYDAFYGLEKQIALKDVEKKAKTYTIKIPEGIRDGEKIRLIGQGKPGKNGGKPGDLLIKINIESDNKFRLQGPDIYTDLCLTPWEAALGTRTFVKTIDDETKIYIPQGIETGEKVRIPNKGYKINKEERGDLVAEIKIVNPKQLTKEEEEIYIRLSEISKFNPRTDKE